MLAASAMVHGKCAFVYKERGEIHIFDVDLSVHHFGLDENIQTTIGQIDVTL